MRKKQPLRPDRPVERASRGRKAGATAGLLPSESEVLAFIANAPGRIGKREIARAFGIKGQAKPALKALLKEVERKGLLRRTGNAMRAEGVLPSITLLEVGAVDADGELTAFPVEWNEQRFGPKPVVRLVASRSAAPGLGDRVLARIRAEDDGYIGEALRLDRPPPARVIGVFRSNGDGGGRIVPAARKDRADYLVRRDDTGGAADGELVAAEVLSTASRGLARARVRQRLGLAHDPRNTSLIAIASHGIPAEFPPQVLDDAAAMVAVRLDGRDDLRHLPFITIDPADARDHDDAIWAEADAAPDNAGGYQVKIAIADVAAYVLPQSAIDREALKRGNSVYFPDRVVPMLPERLSNDLCSLRDGEDRPVLLCHLAVDTAGKTRSQRFTRAMIRVAAGLAYEDAQAAIEGGGSPRARAVLDTALQPLWAAYRVLQQARDKRGPLELELPERKIILDEKGRFVGVRTPQRLEAHRLVEEFMIRANVAAAEALKRARTPLLYRIHAEPTAEKLRSLAEFLKSVGIPFALGQVMRPKTFNRILAAARNTPHERLVHEVVLRSQAQASYHPGHSGHFGLGLADYAHFTSPIRRYADLIVHRALISAFRLGAGGLSNNDIADLEDTAERISAAERRAMIAERETVDRLVAAFLADQLGATFDGRISGVVSAGLFVVLADTGADGFLPVQALGHERFELHQAHHALVGARSGTRYQLGDPLTVRLVEVAPLKGGLRFELAAAPELRQPRKQPAKRHQRRRR